VSVIQTELDQSGRNDGGRDLCKRRRRSDVYRTRETKDGVVPHVENIHAETKFMAFPDAGCFD
jgi:hypothetical protein